MATSTNIRQANKGNLGKSFNDRQLAGNVRNLALDQIRKALLGNDEDFRKQLLLRLAPNVLPRLNEHSGNDGTPLILNFDSRLKDVIT